MNWDTDCWMGTELKEILTKWSLVDHSFDENQMENEGHQFTLSRVDYWMILMSRLKQVPADENELVLNSTGLSKLKKEQKCLKRENGNHSDGQSALHKEGLDQMWVVYHPLTQPKSRGWPLTHFSVLPRLQKTNIRMQKRNGTNRKKEKCCTRCLWSKAKGTDK